MNSFSLDIGSQTILSILDGYPQIAGLFIKYRISCIGCKLSSFCDLRDAIKDHKIDEKSFMEEINNFLNIKRFTGYLK
jgi:hybrid cluster-associated redox disulfide protein